MVCLQYQNLMKNKHSEFKTLITQEFLKHNFLEQMLFMYLHDKKF